MKARRKEVSGQQIMRRESYIQQPSAKREAEERWENEGGRSRQEHGSKVKLILGDLRKKRKAIFGVINSNEMKKLLRRRHLAAPVPVM
jgi:hypothetical protein